MTNDEEQLNLLSIFHFVLGGATALFSCFPFIHVALGIAMLAGAMDHGPNPPPRFIGLIFVVIGGVFILLGWTVAVLLLVAGQRLRKRRAHTFCFVVAAISCLLMPLGTVLGIFTILVLNRPTVKAMFAPQSAGPPAP